MVSFTSKIPLGNLSLSLEKEKKEKWNELTQIRMVFVPLQNNVENDKIMTWIGKIENKWLLFLPAEKNNNTQRK